MKKILAAAMAMAMVLSLAACGNSGDGVGQKVVNDKHLVLGAQKLFGHEDVYKRQC